MESVRVVTYNVLSSQLSTVSRYKFPFKRRDINPKYRLEKIKKDIGQLIIGRYWDGNSYQYDAKLKNPIFCLQEISIEWHTELKLFFRTMNYEFECTNYGNYHNGDMGVAIAYPKSYDLLDYRIGRVTKSCKWNSDRDDNRTVNSSEEESEGSPRTINIFNIQEKNRRIWEDVKRCKNRYMALKLKVQDHVLWVATFHMPCAWDCSPLMLSILMLLLKELKYIIEDERLILGGDFNFTPDSSMYRYIQTGQVEAGDLPLAFGRPYNWKFFSFPMNIAESLCYTTKTINCADGKEFCGAIDHIFYTKYGIKYIKTENIELPNGDIYMPNTRHPSDHLPVIAQFQLV